MALSDSSGGSSGEGDKPHLRVALPTFALIAVLGNVAGSALRYPEVGSAVLFPPYAALTAALVVCPRRQWIWFILVGSAAHLAASWPQWSLGWVLLADVGNIVRALCAASLLRWLLPASPRLRSAGALLRFVLAAALVAPALGAAIGAANVVLHGASASYGLAWRAWFVSNALTALAMMPALLRGFELLAARRVPPLRRARVAEAVLLSLAVGATCGIAFLHVDTARWQVPLPFYTPLPVLIWAALRFGPAGASLVLTAVAFAAIGGVDRGVGIFVDPSPAVNVLRLQFFMLLTTVPVLCIAAVDSARKGVLELYGSLLASLHDHVAILDAQGRLLQVNDAWRRFAETSGGAPLHSSLAPDDYLVALRSASGRGDPVARRALEGLARVLAREERRFEMEYADEERGQTFVLTAEALERVEGGAVVMRSDITARSQAQREIEMQQRELSHLSRAAVLGQLSGALAHELNQPLAAILSNADAARHLRAREPLDRAELSEILRDIAAEDRRAADVIQRLRAFYRRGETRRHALAPADLVGEVLGLAHGEMIARHVVSVTSLEEGLPTVQGDRVQLQQVFLNLVLNACEAMSANSTRDRALSVSARRDDGFVHFSVGDRGEGIGPSVIDRLFEPFVTTKPEGLGLGLSISRTIITAHGGRLWAENNADRGATLHCLLPAD